MISDFFPFSLFSAVFRSEGAFHAYWAESMTHSNFHTEVASNQEASGCGGLTTQHGESTKDMFLLVKLSRQVSTMLLAHRNGNLFAHSPPVPFSPVPLTQYFFLSQTSYLRATTTLFGSLCEADLGEEHIQLRSWLIFVSAVEHNKHINIKYLWRSISSMQNSYSATGARAHAHTNTDMPAARRRPRRNSEEARSHPELFLSRHRFLLYSFTPFST